MPLSSLKRTYAGLVTAIALGWLLTGCQSVQYGVSNNAKKPDVSKASDPVDFSRQFVESDVYGLDPYGKLEVKDLPDRRQLQAQWCAKESSPDDKLGSKLSQLCIQQKGKPTPIRGHYWCFRPSDRAVLFDWYDLWDKRSGEEPAACLLGEREKIVVGMPLPGAGFTSPEWVQYWKAANVDKAYDALQALLAPPKVMAEERPVVAKAQKTSVAQSSKPKTVKKITQQELDFRSLNTKDRTVVLEGHKFSYGVLEDTGFPILMLPGKKGEYEWVCVNCFNAVDVRKGFSLASFILRPDGILKFVSISYKKSDIVRLMLVARKGETLPAFGKDDTLIMGYKISCSPTLRKRLEYVMSTSQRLNNKPTDYRLTEKDKKWEPVSESEPLYVGVQNACFTTR